MDGREQGSPHTNQADRERARKLGADMRAKLERNVVMSDQEIRARALECASRLPASLTGLKAGNVLETMFWETVHDFEAYIRDGVT